jgi:hypothetical protein
MFAESASYIRRKKRIKLEVQESEEPEVEFSMRPYYEPYEPEPHDEPNTVSEDPYGTNDVWGMA